MTDRLSLVLAMSLSAAACSPGLSRPAPAAPDASATGGAPASGGQTGGATGGGGGTGGAVGDPTPPDASVPPPDGARPPDAVSTGGGTVADPGKEGDGDYTVQPPYVLPPEATGLKAGVTAGKMDTVMVTSQLLASRMITVYTPAGYVPGTPAPFMVMQDGPAYINNFKFNVVLDNMIAAKDIPALICIFVPNGGAKRSFEYDQTTDLYLRFVLTDVLPAVEKSLPIKLTTDPEGRSAGGHSSGGIAAFTMGWLKPDQFKRILTNSGSFVNIGGGGGNKYPAMIQAAPAKPLRVFLSAGTKDQLSPQWQKANQAMAAALSAQDYHYRFVMLNDGTHNQMFPATIMPETLKWLWRGYPLGGTGR